MGILVGQSVNAIHKPFTLINPNFTYESHSYLPVLVFPFFDSP